MSARLASSRTTIGDVRMFARVGTGQPRCPAPAVVMVHGLVISSLYMVPSARLLAESLPVLAPDLPGFGRSGKPDRVLNVPELADALAAWMEAVGLASAALVANSLGCQVVADLAARRPALVEALVLAGPTMDPSARKAGVQVARWVRDWPLERPSLALAHVRDYALAGARRALGTFRHALADRIEEKPARVVRAFLGRATA